MGPYSQHPLGTLNAFVQAVVVSTDHRLLSFAFMSVFFYLTPSPDELCDLEQCLQVIAE